MIAELNKHVVGQLEAKRAVAIALRNRWRRQRLPELMRREIVPRNILMIGPTGCGKTEIARRLSQMLDAPFIKVRAQEDGLCTCVYTTRTTLVVLSWWWR